jgi:hypothetical protein
MKHDFLFEVKESLEEGGIDRYGITYKRKRKNKREARATEDASSEMH